MFHCTSSNQTMMNDVWSNEWVDITLKSFNVPGEMEWDKCDVCKVPTHIHVAKWTILDNVTTLLCKQCQTKYNYSYG